MDIDHCTIIIVGVIILFYTNHVSKFHVELNVFSYAEDMYIAMVHMCIARV